MAEFARGPPSGLLAKDVEVVPIGGIEALEKLAPLASWDLVVGDIAFKESIDVADEIPSDNRLLLSCANKISKLLSH